MPTTKEIDTFLHHQLELWNAVDRGAFVAAYKAIAPGGFKVEDPVGTPIQHGWEALEALWDKYQPAGIKIYPELVIVAVTGDAVMHNRNERPADSGSEPVHSLEVLHFGADGTVHARYFSPGATG
jgi:hypothetical protein